MSKKTEYIPENRFQAPDSDLQFRIADNWNRSGCIYSLYGFWRSLARICLRADRREKMSDAGRGFADVRMTRLFKGSVPFLDQWVWSSKQFSKSARYRASYSRRKLPQLSYSDLLQFYLYRERSPKLTTIPGGWSQFMATRFDAPTDHVLDSFLHIAGLIS